jgi:putative PIN family toxin of toxin-antitoxin system
LRVVLDTNVLISAIVFGGIPRKILETVYRGELSSYFSAAIIDELKAVLERPKFGFPSEILQTILSELYNIGIFITPKSRVDLLTEDPDDNRILECAVEADATFLITGDSHLLNLERYNNISIMSPAEYLTIYTQNHT